MSAEGIAEVKQEREHLAKRQKTHIDSLHAEIDNLIECIEGLKQKIQNDQINFKDSLHAIQKEVKSKLQKVQKAHKDFHSQISKFGKVIDKNFNGDQQKAYKENWQVQEHTLDLIVAEHLYREGLFKVGEIVEQAAGVKVSDVYKNTFKELHLIMDQLKQRNVTGALQWCQTKRTELLAHGSSLEFQIHKLRYVQLLTASPEAQAQGFGGVKQAIAYARGNFNQFSQQNMDEIRYLMGAILFANKLASSPYKDLLNEDIWDTIRETFNKEYCAIAEEAIESPLLVSVTAGSMALPTLLKLVAIKEQHSRVVTSASDQSQPADQLSVEVSLGPEFYFHSIFACPVSKEQTTVQNPPMVLVCGHVISKEAILRLIRNFRYYTMNRQEGSNEKFKCPYCPTETTLSDCREVHF